MDTAQVMHVRRSFKPFLALFWVKNPFCNRDSLKALFQAYHSPFFLTTLEPFCPFPVGPKVRARPAKVNTQVFQKWIVPVVHFYIHFHNTKILPKNVRVHTIIMLGKEN